MHEDLANLDALAAGPQRILHALPAADDADATQPLGKVNSHVLVPGGSDHCALSKGQVPQASLHHLQAGALQVRLPADLGRQTYASCLPVSP